VRLTTRQAQIFFASFARQISAQAFRFAILRSGVLAERRKFFEIKERGFLPKAATFQSQSSKTAVAAA
jgi:hypothetical protein